MNRRFTTLGLPAGALLFLAVGSVAHISPGTDPWPDRIWTVGLFVVGIPIILRTIIGMLRGRFAADLVAALAIGASMALNHPFAGLVVALMQSGGEALEQFAERRATQAVRELESQAPRIGHKIVATNIQDVPVDQIAIGDTLLVRPGEMLPCDGVVVDGISQIDTARISGEPIPVPAAPGLAVRSGSVNLDGPLTMRATALARESLYAQIVELVRTAQNSKAPLQRIADRYAIWFTPITLIVCGVAYFLSHDPNRVLAVLVVATPCPLILATPVAILGGINRAARRQIIMRHGGALEQLGLVDTAIFDKTGTLTIGRPAVETVVCIPPYTERELLRLAGAVEQSSGHLLARTLVDAARRLGIKLPFASKLNEVPGLGISGEVEEHSVMVGALSLMRERFPAAAATLERLDQGATTLRAYVAVDGRAAGTVIYADRIRPGLPQMFARLKQLGVTRTLLLSGDRTPTVAAVAREVGIDEAEGDLLPEDKLRTVERLRAEGRHVLMVGDGVNDAPALSAAAVGLALAAHGGGIAAESADVVLLADDLSRVPEAIAIGRNTLRIAKQSIGAGLGLSALAMVIAALGFIPPTIGALLQEAIDVAVILNALRASVHQTAHSSVPS